MNILINIVISAVVMIGVANTPLKYLELWQPERPFGSTITTLLGSDTLTSSRSVINTNFSNLNSDKIEATQSTLSSLSSIGTITTGVWNGTPITATYGGTGSTTLANNYVLVGNGTGIVKTALGIGSSGQFLTSQGVGLQPQWTTGVIDQTQDYNWSGDHNFSNDVYVKNLNASSTSANPLILNGISLNTPSTQGATSTTLVNDGSGNLKWQQIGWQQIAVSYPSSGASTTINFSAYENLLVVVFSSTTQTGNANMGMQFNGDTGGNYLYSYSENVTGVVTNIGQVSVNAITLSTDQQNQINVVMNIYNASSTNQKFVNWKTTSQQGGTGSGGGKWANFTDAITSITFGLTAGRTWGTGSRIVVYGSQN